MFTPLQSHRKDIVIQYHSIFQNIYITLDFLEEDTRKYYHIELQYFLVSPKKENAILSLRSSLWNNFLSKQQIHQNHRMKFFEDVFQIQHTCTSIIITIHLEAYEVTIHILASPAQPGAAIVCVFSHTFPCYEPACWSLNFMHFQTSVIRLVDRLTWFYRFGITLQINLSPKVCDLSVMFWINIYKLGLKKYPLKSRNFGNLVCLYLGYHGNYTRFICF